MAELSIRMKKKTDGSSALTCVRADGSMTWQREEGRRGVFFPLHDLTHYAVETTLGHRRGFYGLVAEGWNLSDFGPPWPRGRVPAEAIPSELLVGFLDTERAGAVQWTAADLNDKAALYFREQGLRATPLLDGDEELGRIRARMTELFSQWLALAPGETLELQFDRASIPG